MKLLVLVAIFDAPVIHTQKIILLLSEKLHLTCVCFLIKFGGLGGKSSEI